MANVIRVAPRAFALMVLVAIFLPNTLLAQEAIAVVAQIKGGVNVERSGTTSTVAQGDALFTADVVRTGSDAAIGLRFTDGALIALGPDTVYAVDTYSFDTGDGRGDFLSTVERGSLSIRSGRIAKQGQDRMRVRTPASILGVRGTRFLVRVDPED